MAENIGAIEYVITSYSIHYTKLYDARALQFLEVVDEPLVTADVKPKRQRKTKPQ